MFHMMWKKSIWFEHEEINVYMHFPLEPQPKNHYLVVQPTTPFFYKNSANFTLFALKSNATKKNTLPQVSLNSHRHAARRRRY